MKSGTHPTPQTADGQMPEVVSCTCCPLNQVKIGTAVRIKKLCAAPEMTRRLREVGVCEERVIRLLNAPANVICLVCNARLALSAELASLILVEPVK